MNGTVGVKVNRSFITLYGIFSNPDISRREWGDGSKSLFSVVLNRPISYTDFDSIFYGTKEKESGFNEQKACCQK